MIYFKTNNQEYPAEISSLEKDYHWGDRKTCTIKLTMAYAEAAQLFVNGLVWGVVQRDTVSVYDESGQPTGETKESVQEWDYSDYCVAGPITDNRDGTCTCKMGKKTETELLREVSADAEQAAKILLGEAE
nr:MAG TPA: hypothetical protein [Caudoviricetes sp.]